MTMSTSRACRDRLGDETRSLLRALLLGSIVEHRVATAPTEDHLTVHAAERALARLDAEVYGTCERCGDAMLLDVLLVTPHAQWCGWCPTPVAAVGELCALVDVVAEAAGTAERFFSDLRPCE